MVDSRWSFPRGTAAGASRPSFGAHYTPSPSQLGAEIYTLDFAVPRAISGKEPYRLNHEFELPRHLNAGLAYFETSKVLYHGSDWLEIGDIVSDRCSILGSKIFASALEAGKLNELRWRITVTTMTGAGPSWMEVINRRPREGHFKMSLMGKWSIP